MPLSQLMLRLTLAASLSSSVFLPAFANELKGHHSPYLAMHGDDPIAWHSWGDEALAKARKENKLLYVSIGYFACHWCHVMHQESFVDPSIAKQLNENYIPIKVDRELNPVLDKRLIEFVQVTNGVAGWPLNVFITPEGYPLVGGTYMPRDHFSGVLETIDQRWSKDSALVMEKAKDLSKQLSGMLGILELTTQKISIASQAALFLEKAMEEADDLQGGFSNQKFPNFPQIHALLEINAKKPNPEIDEFLRLTIDAISTKGLHDAIGGGFFRYTVDPGWKTPHYEKMLYTNAQLPILLFKAADYFNHKPYRDVALETIDFMQREMRGKDAFIASLSAVDNEGNEGAYYLYTEDDIRAALNKKEQAIAFAVWDLKRPPEQVSGNLPIQSDSIASLAKDLQMTEAETGKAIDELKLKLQQYRQANRSLPKDNKQLSGWNGLVLSSLAAALPHKPALRQSGDQLAAFLLSLWDGERLKRSAASQQIGTFQDYAAVAKGLLEWSNASGEPRYAAVAASIIDQTWHLFYNNLAWSETSKSLLPNSVAQSHIADTPITSPETLLLEASAMLGGKLMNQRIQSVLALSNRSLNADPFAYASLISFSLTFEKQE